MGTKLNLMSVHTVLVTHASYLRTYIKYEIAGHPVYAIRVNAQPVRLNDGVLSACDLPEMDTYASLEDACTVVRQCAMEAVAEVRFADEIAAGYMNHLQQLATEVYQEAVNAKG